MSTKNNKNKNKKLRFEWLMCNYPKSNQIKSKEKEKQFIRKISYFFDWKIWFLLERK